jgi:Tol biopolymer transport system component
MSDSRKTLLGIALLLTAGILACSMDIGGEGPSKPTVEIVSPASGTRVALGQELEVQYRATDAVAVVRVELEVGRQIVDLQSSPTAEGQPSLTGILRWTPTTAGVHTLLVYAYNRDGVSSDVVGLEIIVEGPAPQPQATPQADAATTRTAATPSVSEPAAILFADDFSDSDSGWSVASEESYAQGYEGGEYFVEHIQLNNASRWQTYPDQSFSDFTAEVEVRFEAEDEYVGAALIWRWQDNNNFYVFRIRNTGEYDLFKRVDGEWDVLIPHTASPHINSGVATNSLRVVAIGDLIRIYVNDYHLADLIESSFTEGKIGLYGSVYTESPISTRVFFDNLEVAEPTVAQAQLTPTVGPTPTVPNRPLALEDDFADPESGFDVSSTDKRRKLYEDGQYTIEMLVENLVTWTGMGRFSDFVMEVDVISLEEAGQAGVVFRKEGETDMYFFFVTPDGRYRLNRYLGGSWATWMSWRESPHIRTGVATNRLRVVCEGSEISLYVNDQYLETVHDTTLTEGEIGLVAGAFRGESHALFKFDNLRVYGPDLVGATPGSYPPPSGRIVFASNRDKPEAIYKDIYVMNVDGSGLTRLTNYEFDDAMPRWSPDGRRIAFVSWRDGNWEIYVMNADGSDVIRVTDNPASDLGPRWSPDGQRIAFYSDRDGNEEIYVMGADGSAQINVSNNSARDRVADWSPDGERIAFCSDRGGDEDVYVMKQDGSEVTNLTRNPAKDYAPSWSPDGQRIVFESDRRSEGNADIYVMDADGSGLVRLTNYAQSDSAAGWSPDGRYIHFSREVSGAQGRWEMYIMRADGSEQTNISRDPSANYRDRDWSASP